MIIFFIQNLLCFLRFVLFGFYSTILKITYIICFDRISMITELNNSVAQANGRESQEKILNGLTSYSKEHFATEERLFDRYAYPWSVTHKAEHAAFTQKVTQFVQDYKAGKTGINNQILAYLSDWLKNHIIGKDKTYSYFFAMKGVK